MSFTSVEKMLRAAAEHNCTLSEAILQSDLPESGMTAEESRTQMAHLWQVMQQTSHDYAPSDRSNSGLVGGDAAKIHAAYAAGQLIGGSYLNRVIEEALKTAECNACMKRIVAAPTAGSCGVLPAVLLPLWEDGSVTEDAVFRALYVAAGFGQVTAFRASVSGAEGGCQAEVGVASAMAAAALVSVFGGSDQQCADAFAMALGNLLGLVCDPVAGLVEIPCVKRNVVGAVNAVSSANMALAGLGSRIPADEVIDAMGEIGDLMHSDLRETGVGGLAGTPSAHQIVKTMREHWANTKH